MSQYFLYNILIILLLNNVNIYYFKNFNIRYIGETILHKYLTSIKIKIEIKILVTKLVEL